MNPLARCRVLGCQEPTVYEMYGQRTDRDGRPIYGGECARHELDRWRETAAEATWREVQLLHLIGEA